MLAQSFLSAEDLQITEPERDALIKTLHRFETNPPEKKIAVEFNSGADVRDLKYFSFQFVAAEIDCGTVGCIKGWAQNIANNDRLFWSPSLSRALIELFGLNPSPEYLFDYLKVTTEHAAFALRNFLTRGAAHWEEIL